MTTVELAQEFLSFCQANPHFRFWQALASWSSQRWPGCNFILTGRVRQHIDPTKDFEFTDIEDTYYWGNDYERFNTGRD